MKISKLLIFLFLILIVSSGISSAQGSKKIAYSSNKSSNDYCQIFIMNEDGKDKVQLTNLDANCYSPEFSPDGRSIVFYTDEGRVYYIADFDSVMNRPPEYIFPGIYPSFFLGSEYIIFNAELDGPMSIYVIGIGENEPDMLSWGSYANQQEFSSDGTIMVFSAFDNGSKSVFMLDLTDTTENALRQISVNTDSNLEPDVNADGNMVVYASFNSNLNGTIYIYKNGKETSLTKGASWNNPLFSPDGSKIGCVKTNENESTELYVMNIDGSDKKELSVKGGNVGSFRWIDNENILYDAENGSSSVIGIINIKTDKVTTLAKEGINIQPCIQPDYQPDDEQLENIFEGKEF